MKEFLIIVFLLLLFIFLVSLCRAARRPTPVPDDIEAEVGAAD